MSAKINISNEFIQLDGFINDTVDFDVINKVEYLDNFEIHGGKKGAGFSNNGYFSGNADFKGIGQCRAYVYYHEKYFVVIYADEETIIFNEKSEEETKNMYDKLKDKIDSAT